MSCIAVGCTGHTGKKSIMCGKHWMALPESLRIDLRRDMEKGQGTLRAKPTKEWLEKASHHIGKVRNLSIQVDAAERVIRKVEPDDILT